MTTDTRIGYEPPAVDVSPFEGDVAPLDVDRLRQAIYVVGLRHRWAETTDNEDRTEEIAAEYASPAQRTEDQP